MEIRGCPVAGGASGLGRHEIERPRGAESGVAIAAIGPPDAGAMHLDLAMDQTGRRFGVVDAGGAPVPRPQDRAGSAERQQLQALIPWQ